MIVFYPENHYQHNILEVFNGIIMPTAETSERVNRIKKELEQHGNFEFRKPTLCNDKLIEQIHDKNYLQFIKSNSSQQLEYPSVFNYTDEKKPPENSIAKKGYYIFDTYTPLTKNIWQIAKESASCAISGSDLLIKNEGVVYALCRPPGHHATKNMAGGYCYLNNSALAAQNLINKNAKKIVILDIDFHHGNGTQNIFYDRSDVLFISLHADPKRKFPYFSGKTSEKGIKKGMNYNYNFPLPENTNDNAFLTTLNKATKIIKKYNPNYLIVSVGLDPYEKDPICDFKISLSGFNKIGKKIASLPYKTLLVQEGGYCLEDLGKCALEFLKPFINK